MRNHSNLGKIMQLPYIYIYIYIYKHTHTHIYIQIYIYIFIYKFISWFGFVKQRSRRGLSTPTVNTFVHDKTRVGQAGQSGTDVTVTVVNLVRV